MRRPVQEKSADLNDLVLPKLFNEALEDWKQQMAIKARTFSDGQVFLEEEQAGRDVLVSQEYYLRRWMMVQNFSLNQLLAEHNAAHEKLKVAMKDFKAVLQTMPLQQDLKDAAVYLLKNTEITRQEILWGLRLDNVWWSRLDNVGKEAALNLLAEIISETSAVIQHPELYQQYERHVRTIQFGARNSREIAKMISLVALSMLIFAVAVGLYIGALAVIGSTTAGGGAIPWIMIGGGFLTMLCCWAPMSFFDCDTILANRQTGVKEGAARVARAVKREALLKPKAATFFRIASPNSTASARDTAFLRSDPTCGA